MRRILPLIAIFLLLLVSFFFFSKGSTEVKPLGDEVLVQDEVPIVYEPVTQNVPPTLRDSIIAYGVELLGIPYVTAGCSVDGFDCSGFVFFVFKHFNITVPRSSSLYKNFGTEIPIDSVQLGDVLVFKSPSRDAIGHLGIVTKPNGMETEFIHATSGKAMQVVISSLKKEGYRKRLIKAVNVLD